MKYKVIFDTNSIRNAESISDFLGSRSDLERFLKVSEIIIPDIVVEELKIQKKKQLISKRNAFLDNPFHILRKIDKKETRNFDIDYFISNLEGNEKIPYTIIYLTKQDTLERIRKLCIINNPPFEEKTDKGFKDAYIYLTILEYLELCGEEKVFFVTNDDRLTLAFEGNNQIKVVKDYDEFEKLIDVYFYEEYFINRLKEIINKEITKENIEKIWLNFEDNWIIKLNFYNKVYFFEIDFMTREVISFNSINFSDDIFNLINSNNYQMTHSSIANLIDVIKYFSDSEMIQLIQASTENNQIYWIAKDDDVNEFFNTIYKYKSKIIPDEVKIKFRNYYFAESENDIDL